MTVSEHVPIEVLVRHLPCALGTCSHENAADHVQRWESVCAACVPVPVDSDGFWYEREHVWPCAVVQAEARRVVSGFDVDQLVPTSTSLGSSE